MGLCQRQRAAPRADPERFCLHPLRSVVTGVPCIRLSLRPQYSSKTAHVTPLRILGIETSCDETAASVVLRDADGQWRDSGDVVLSQLEEHSVYGGVVPEIAARAHVEALDTLVEEALLRAGVTLRRYRRDCRHQRPGPDRRPARRADDRQGDRPRLRQTALCGQSSRRPCADGAADRRARLSLSDAAGFRRPYAAYPGARMSASTSAGARRSTMRWEKPSTRRRSSSGLPYPGGPAVERAAKSGNPDRFSFPRPLVGEARLDFSFSGLKTAVRQAAQSIEPVTDQDIADICASFQKAISRTLKDRIGRGLARFKERIRRHGRKAGTGGGRRRRGQPGAARDARRNCATRTAFASWRRRFSFAPTMRR